MIDDMTDLRDLSAATAERVLALNNAHAAELSWLEPEKLQRMIAEAYFARAIGEADAFMISFDQDADYGSPNFLWFKERYPRFAYVDRVVVAPHARGRGLARRLYEGLFRQAAADGHTRIVCEVNAEPPNPASDAFHAALGFSVVGSAEVYGGERTVRYYARVL
ncbi:GNAT family N-acetyltransferase [Pseudaminobacter sp. 19-2017]|uniref:GNAT family N-acetyltransferase n=1 Tax=Pseudaminobacter soli (ex Zhang et al. 2022) TaxID=2831468 RepID=A0A942E150_9HYPH|nr:GNAT family N-acetyltransferase [Pseudaminobacter soli]MBS3649000.1 GNAT family N-acetyltransferase [Pseudaminobacter soli]